MPLDLSDKIVVGVSSRALFDLQMETKIYEEEGLAAFSAYQRKNEQSPLRPGTAFQLVESLLRLNQNGNHIVEVVILSRNHPDVYLRIRKSIDHHGLNISRAVLTGGEPITRYTKALKVDLFLSSDLSDVRDLIKAGFAAAQVFPPAALGAPTSEIRIAFDGDCVLFNGDAERVNRSLGLSEFHAHEQRNSDLPLPDGPFAKLLRKLSKLQRSPGNPFRLALITARNAPADERAIKTLRSWGVSLDNAAFLGGMSKTEVLEAFQPHMFFDDTPENCESAAPVVNTARVPYEIPEECSTSDSYNSRYLKACSTYLGEREKSSVPDLNTWYNTRVRGLAEPLQLRFVARVEESLQGTLNGLDRRSRGTKDTRLGKLQLYLERLLVQVESTHHDEGRTPELS